MSDEEIKEIKEEAAVEETTPAEPQVSEEVPEVKEVTTEATEEVSEEPIMEEHEEKVEESSDNPEDVPEADTEVPEGDKPEEESTEVEEEKKEEVPEEESIEPTVDERLAEAERKLAEYEEAKLEAESLARLNDVENAIAQHLQETQQAVMKSVEDLAKKYGIPTNISIEDLEKQDPTKAAIAREISQNARNVLMQKQQEMEQAREVEAAKVVFAKAEKLFDRHNLTQEQAEVAADTFLAIIKETGVQNLGQDLIEKVELSVAKALMKVPVAMEVHDKIEEIKNADTGMGHSDTKDLEKPTAEIAEDTDSKVEEKSEVPPPDLSEFMEGASGSRTAENPEAVTSENVIQKINSIADFRERTKFLAEHMDEFNEAMKNRKG